jgi:hypothetical protein
VRATGTDALVELVGSVGTRLLLGPLDDASSAELASLAAGRSRDATDVARASGNPLLIIEMARNADAPDTSASSALLSRLSDFGPDARHVVNIAAVLGESFSLARLSRLVAEPVPAVAARVTDLLGAGVFVDRGDSIAFRHDLLRDAVYDAIPPSVRRGLHGPWPRTSCGAPMSATSTRSTP